MFEINIMYYSSILWAKQIIFYHYMINWVSSILGKDNLLYLHILVIKINKSDIKISTSEILNGLDENVRINQI